MIKWVNDPVLEPGVPTLVARRTDAGYGYLWDPATGDPAALVAWLRQYDQNFTLVDGTLYRKVTDKSLELIELASPLVWFARLATNGEAVREYGPAYFKTWGAAVVAPKVADEPELTLDEIEAAIAEVSGVSDLMRGPAPSLATPPGDSPAGSPMPAGDPSPDGPGGSDGDAAGASPSGAGRTSRTKTKEK